MNSRAGKRFINFIHEQTCKNQALNCAGFRNRLVFMSLRVSNSLHIILALWYCWCTDCFKPLLFRSDFSQKRQKAIADGFHQQWLFIWKLAGADLVQTCKPTGTQSIMHPKAPFIKSISLGLFENRKPLKTGAFEQFFKLFPLGKFRYSRVYLR